MVPGQYPTSPGSQLLRNDGKGKFSATKIPTGMVTGALWSDADGDGWLDLLITQEWGAVKLFKNTGGKLGAARTISASGWWNGITGGDFDNDGDLDYAVTNFGLNTKYHASTEKPALIYYGDLDGSGKKRIIEAEFEGSVCYPIRGKSCSTHAIPSLAEKFPTYKDFALAELGKIYEPSKLRRHRSSPPRSCAAGS